MTKIWVCVADVPERSDDALGRGQEAGKQVKKPLRKPGRLRPLQGETPTKPWRGKHGLHQRQLHRSKFKLKDNLEN